MGLPQPLAALFIDRNAGFPNELVGEEAAGHADLAVDAPDGELDAFAVERLLPGQHMFIDAVDERAVEIEQEDGFDAHSTAPIISDRGLR